MTLTSRGKKVAAAVAAVGIGLGALAVLLASGKAPEPLKKLAEDIGVVPEEPPTCPLTGEEAPGGAIAERPALAVKVENIPESRPQAGLQLADVVYEEPVEGGITRFIAIFQCRDAGRVGPVRSGRLTDPDVLVQYGSPSIGYSGGVAAVRNAIERAGLQDVSFSAAPDAYERDPARSSPHDLFTSTGALYEAAKNRSGVPEAVFAYDEVTPKPSRKGVRIHLPFSTWSDVVWRWSPGKGRYLRFHGTEPHALESGVQVSAANVVVMVVKVTPGKIVDVNGVPSPEVELTGSGKAYVLRDGRVILGRWTRASLEDPTTFETKAGEEIALAPGPTWVELLPDDVEVGLGKVA